MGQSQHVLYISADFSQSVTLSYHSFRQNTSVQFIDTMIYSFLSNHLNLECSIFLVKSYRAIADDKKNMIALQQELPNRKPFHLLHKSFKKVNQ